MGKIAKELLLILKIQGEKDKLQDGEAIEDVQKWGVDIEGEIDETDCEISHLNQYLTEAEARTENEVSNTEGNFVIPVNVTKVDRRDLLSVVNPTYPELISRFQHLTRREYGGNGYQISPSSTPHIGGSRIFKYQD